MKPCSFVFVYVSFFGGEISFENPNQTFKNPPKKNHFGLQRINHFCQSLLMPLEASDSQTSLISPHAMRPPALPVVELNS